MDKTTALIVSVSALPNFQVEVQLSDGQTVQADLSRFKTVFCFPKSDAEWQKVSVDSHGLDLIWASRFEVHVDQLLANQVGGSSSLRLA
jgi:Protein of unknown function (DUF2442)